MFTLIENGDVYAPQHVGRSSVLIAGDSILKIGAVDARDVERLGIPVEVVEEE